MSPRARRTATWAEMAIIAALTVFYFQCFRVTSPLNGPKEVFDQDSTYILRSLIAGTRYRYNPQHHLLYHALTERLHGALVEPFWKRDAQSVYVFLKVFTAATGAAFLLTLRHLLLAMGLSPLRRMILILFAAFSVTAWFNFAGLETHSLGLWAYNVLLLAALRLTRDRVFRRSQVIFLAAALAFAALSRFDNLRMIPLLGLLVPVIPRRLGRRLLLSLALAGVLTVAGYVAVAKVYFDAPLAEVPQQILKRSDRHDLSPRLKRIRNLTPHLLAQMGRATSVYTVMMAPGRARFAAPLEATRHGALYEVAVTAMLLFWVRLAIPLARGLRRRDLFLWLVTASWVGSLVFFTWFDPFEPFLWLLEFLPFLIAVAAYTLRKAGRPTWAFLALCALVAMAHNWVSFYQRFDL